MAYDPISSFAALIGCAVVGIFFYFDFHAPFHHNVIRYSVAQRLYILALSVYICCYLILFLLFLGLLQLLFDGLFSLYTGTCTALTAAPDSPNCTLRISY